jgi:lysophospholipase L1-like esterase
MIKILLFSFCFASFIPAALAGDPPLARESIEWCDLWISHANETNLPRVLLIGDSITRGYYPEVEKRLAGKAYVGRLATSAFISDPMLNQEIVMVLDSYKFDVIQFNNGLHGLSQHTEEEYRKAFPKFLATIQKHSHGAKLIWADSTPIKNDAASNKRIATRNAIALELVTAQGIPADDLNTLVQGHPEYHGNDNVHFNDQGIAVEGEQAANQIEKLLSP